MLNTHVNVATPQIFSSPTTCSLPTRPHYKIDVNIGPENNL